MTHVVDVWWFHQRAIGAAERSGRARRAEASPAMITQARTNHPNMNVVDGFEFELARSASGTCFGQLALAYDLS